MLLGHESNFTDKNVASSLPGVHFISLCTYIDNFFCITPPKCIRSNRGKTDISYHESQKFYRGKQINSDVYRRKRIKLIKKYCQLGARVHVENYFEINLNTSKKKDNINNFLTHQCVAGQEQS